MVDISQLLTLELFQSNDTSPATPPEDFVDYLLLEAINNHDLSSFSGKILAIRWLERQGQKAGYLTNTIYQKAIQVLNNLID